MNTTTATMKSPSDAQLPFRHTLATLAYRAAKALKEAPAGFSEFRPGKDSRSAGEILSHLCDLFDWSLSMAQGKEQWHDTEPKAWNEDMSRFFAALEALDSYVASGQTLHAPCERMFQGAVADALTHVGQIAMLRRLSGGPIRPENYSVARIEAGRVGWSQNAPVAEF